MKNLAIYPLFFGIDPIKFAWLEHAEHAFIHSASYLLEKQTDL